MPQTGSILNGSELKKRREALLLTQEMLARKADIHPNTLLRMESDPEYRAGFKTIRKVARQLKCDPTHLLRATEQEAAS
jgi:DNA-binding XRE family transcriptional regulator